MCMGGKSSSQPQQQAIPAPNPPTTFDYNAARDEQQRRANAAVNKAQTSTVLSSTGGGAETLGGMPQTTY